MVRNDSGYQYLNKRTGDRYKNLLEAQEKLGILGYVSAVESGDIVKI